MFVEFFIRRPVFSTVCSLIVVLAGAISIPNLAVAQYPVIEPPQVTVTAYYTGASAEVVESAVTAPIEQLINGVEGMKYMSSTSDNNGTSTIYVTFGLERNLDVAAVDVQNRVFGALGKLPNEVKMTGILVEKSSSAVVLGLSLHTDNEEYSEGFISSYADTVIRNALKRIKGVGEVYIFGERKYAMRLWLDPNRLAARKLSAVDVLSALEEQNVQVASGYIGQPPSAPSQTYQISVRAIGRLKDPAEFGELILKTGADGVLVKLKDVGTAELGAEDYRTVLRYNRKNSVGVEVYQLPKANALEVERAVQAELKRLSQSFPPGLKYKVAFNPVLYVQESINEVTSTLLESIILVVVVIFVFLHSWRSTLIPAITIPVSLIGTFAFIKAFNFSINTLSLFGLTLATGLVVDDAIVVIENVERLLHEKRLSPREATSRAMAEVSGAVIATSIVLIAVFIPVGFFPGTAGLIYKQFAITIAFSIALSAFAALTLTPSLTAMFLRPTAGPRDVFAQAVENVLQRVRNGYARSLAVAMRHWRITCGVFAVCLGLTAWMYRVVPGGFIPVEDQGYFIVMIQAPEGASLAYTDRVMAEAEKVLLTFPEIDDIFAVGGGTPTGTAANKASIYPGLLPMANRKRSDQSLHAVIERAKKEFAKIPGAVIIPFHPPALPGIGNFGGFQFEIQDRSSGSNRALYDATAAFVSEANKQPELTEVFSPFTVNDPQLVIEVDRDKVKAMNVPLREIFATLQVGLGSQYVNDFDFLNRSYRVYVQAHQAFRATEKDIGQFNVKSLTGEMIPLSNLIRINHVTAPQTLSHFNMFRAADVTGDAAPGYSTGQAIEAMNRVAKKVLPAGMGYEWTGIAKEQLESGSQGVIIFLLGIVFVYLVLAAQYESFVLPFIVLLAVPLAILGALLAQWARGLQNDIYCQVGLVMLVGLASKNSILIVEFANQLRKTGLSVPDAATQAAHTRLRPILMTSLAFMLGVLPLVFASGAGEGSRHSLGTAVFGGMFVSTVLSLYAIPVLYTLIESTREKRAAAAASKRVMLQPGSDISQ